MFNAIWAQLKLSPFCKVLNVSEYLDIQCKTGLYECKPLYQIKTVLSKGLKHHFRVVTFLYKY